MEEYDVIVIGGGPAGLSSAIAAKKQNVDNVIIIDSNDNLGGLLNQCIHDGFGMGIFKENLTGPEYAKKLISMVEDLNIYYKTGTTVLNIKGDKNLTLVNSKDGVFKIKGKAIVYAAGARELGYPKIGIDIHKRAGIYTAGTVQRLVNIEGYVPGKNVVILGTSDLGLVVAGRLCIEGVKVQALIEPNDKISGQMRNYEKWVRSFNVPLKLKYDVIKAYGNDRITSVDIVKLDDQGNRVMESRQKVECDCLILASRLIPETELIENLGIKMCMETGGPIVNDKYETSIEGIFACGNTVKVNDFADCVSLEGVEAGRNAGKYAKSNKK